MSNEPFTLETTTTATYRAGWGVDVVPIWAGEDAPYDHEHIAEVEVFVVRITREDCKQLSDGRRSGVERVGLCGAGARSLRGGGARSFAEGGELAAAPLAFCEMLERDRAVLARQRPESKLRQQQADLSARPTHC